MINPMDLTGKHFVVTGASSGIGAEIARHIARLGGRVSLLARNIGRLNEVVASMEGSGHAAFSVDLSDPANLEDVMRGIVSERGRFDGGVYSAGLGDACPLKLMKPGKMAAMANVNYLSYIEFVRCITLKKNRAETMSVVGISSIESAHGDKGKTMYCSTKAAIDGAMRAMAHELAQDGVRVNNIQPGWVRTDMYENQIKMLGEEVVAKELEMFQYIGRPIETIDVANAAAFLLSDASRYVTGTTMVVAGGYLS